MDQPYNAFADWLSKFHTSSEPIQALWIVAIAATVVGLAYFAKEIIIAALHPHRHSGAAKRNPSPRGFRKSSVWDGACLEMSADMGSGPAPSARPGMTSSNGTALSI
jgi:hypothetical protein